MRLLTFLIPYFRRYYGYVGLLAVFIRPDVVQMLIVRIRLREKGWVVVVSVLHASQGLTISTRVFLGMPAGSGLGLSPLFLLFR